MSNGFGGREYPLQERHSTRETGQVPETRPMTNSSGDDRDREFVDSLNSNCDSDAPDSDPPILTFQI